jgi:hypothetical protein
MPRTTKKQKGRRGDKTVKIKLKEKHARQTRELQGPQVDIHDYSLPLQYAV